MGKKHEMPGTIVCVFLVSEASNTPHILMFLVTVVTLVEKGISSNDSESSDGSKSSDRRELKQDINSLHHHFTITSSSLHLFVYLIMLFGRSCPTIH